jgi:hypothetical protein
VKIWQMLVAAFNDESVVASRKANAARYKEHGAVPPEQITVMQMAMVETYINTGVLSAAVTRATSLDGSLGSAVRSVPSIWVRVVALFCVAKFMGAVRDLARGVAAIDWRGSLAMHGIRGRRGLDLTDHTVCGLASAVATQKPLCLACARHQPAAQSLNAASTGLAAKKVRPWPLTAGVSLLFVLGITL